MVPAAFAEQPSAEKVTKSLWRQMKIYGMAGVLLLFGVISGCDVDWLKSYRYREMLNSTGTT